MAEYKIIKSFRLNWKDRAPKKLFSGKILLQIFRTVPLQYVSKNLFTQTTIDCLTTNITNINHNDKMVILGTAAYQLGNTSSRTITEIK